MENDPEMIRQQMGETRAALTEKLERLEQKVVGTVQDASTAVNETVGNVKEAVQDTVQNVKDSVHETVETVKGAFDIRYQTAQRPWTMMTGAVGLGFLSGYLLNRSGAPDRSERGPFAENLPAMEQRSLGEQNGRHFGDQQFTAGAESTRPASRSQPGIFERLGETFEEEISQLKGLAIGTMLGVIRDMAKDSVPEPVSHKVEDVINSITQKLGGQPVAGRLLPEKDGMADQEAEQFSHSAASGNHPPCA